MSALGLATIKRTAPVPRLVAAERAADAQTLAAVVQNRYHVLADYAKALRKLGATEIKALQTMQAMRGELASLWERSMATREQLVVRLQDWCRRAEASGVRPLAEFSRRLRCYA